MLGGDKVPSWGGEKSHVDDFVWHRDTPKCDLWGSADLQSPVQGLAQPQLEARGGSCCPALSLGQLSRLPLALEKHGQPKADPEPAAVH